MSYAFHAWALDLEALRTRCATRSTLAEVVAAQPEAVADFGRWFADEIEEGAPRLDQALGRLLQGDSGHGWAQAYALELICRHIGQRLPDEGLSGIRWSWVERVDQALASAGCPFRLAELEDPPVRLPTIPDFPMVGLATRHELAQLEALPTPEDPDVALAFASLRAWARSGRDVVTFYY